MTRDELAKILDGRECGSEITRAEAKMAKESGLVVIYGASDDLAEIEGAFDDELDVSDGGFIPITKDGLLQNKCDDEDCPYFAVLVKHATTIEAVWSDETGEPAWSYRTTIPHSTFNIKSDADEDLIYCRGIVFALADVP